MTTLTNSILKSLTLIILITLINFTLASINSELIHTDNNQQLLKWEIITSTNYTYQIHLHPHILLLVTVPWCGESRSLMKEISQKISMDQNKYNSLKLMLIHRNVDQVLAKSLDAMEGITFLYYQKAVSYKFKGTLRVDEILSSIHHLMSLPHEYLPFERLTNNKDLQMLTTSTDKAVLIFDSCGWTSGLLTKHKGNVTMQGGLNEEINTTLAFPSQKKFNVNIYNEATECDIENGCSTSPWVGEYSAENGTASSETEYNKKFTFEVPCNFEEYRKYESFFSKFIEITRDRILPPQRQRYGIVSDRSLLSTLGVDTSDQWSLIISYAGCPDCLRVVNKEDHLGALQMVDLPVMELEDKRNDVGPTLPINNPSIILFVDRMFDSTETRKTSQKALNAFREVAKQQWNPNYIGHNAYLSKESSTNSNLTPRGAFRNQRLLLSSSSKTVKLKDKMSIMIINEGKEVALDNEALNLQSGSLHEILTQLIGQRKNLKLSSVAKEAGFNLLSNDIDIQISQVFGSNTEKESQTSGQQSVDDVSDNGLVDVIKDNEGLNSAQQEDLTEAANVDIGLDTSSYVTNETQGQKSHFGGFTGSFFFTDGNYELLRSLTNDSQVPRLVIVDPVNQQHYIFDKVTNISVTSISSFIERFNNGTLSPYQRSGPLRKSSEIQHPPFVNLDFHEKDYIPTITTEIFSELVRGFGQFNDTSTTWDKDVVVLFSTSSCGFCQRMELVFREVYRALQGYLKMVKYEAANKEGISEDELKNTIMDPPKLYLIDCTMNECGLILKTAGQREVYPTLLVFPAGKKTAIAYDGNILVTDIIKFIASHGSISHHIAQQKGILWTDTEESNTDNYKFQDQQMKSASTIESFLSDDPELQNVMVIEPNKNANHMKISIGSYLVATNNMHGLFSESKILLVGANRDYGFLGLIINKPISWDSLPSFEAAFETLKNAPLSFGGPVIHKEMPLVSLTRSALNDKHPQILPDLFYLDHLETMKVIDLITQGNMSANDYWFFWGYSGWGWDQLYSEIDAGVWTVHEGHVDDLKWS